LPGAPFKNPPLPSLTFPSIGLILPQGLFEIPDNVLNILDTNRKA
jgi:hypothetical protein